MFRSTSSSGNDPRAGTVGLPQGVEPLAAVHGGSRPRPMMGTDPAPPRPMLNRVTRALQYRNYRLLWVGQWARSTGHWMQLVATPLVVLSIGGSALDLGIVFALQFVPILFIAPIAGVLADRWPKRRALILIQLGTAVQAALFTLMLATNSVDILWIYTLALILGVLSAFEMPMRSSFVGELVPDHVIPNAAALLSVAFHASRFVGPAIAGLVAALLGYQANFAWSAVVAVITLLLLWMMDSATMRPRPAGSRASVPTELRAGIGYVRTNVAVSSALGILAGFGVFGLSFQTVAPIFTLDVLQLDEGQYGLFVAAMGAGALAASLRMTVVSVSAAHRFLRVAPVGFGVALSALAATQAPAIAFLLVTVLGAFSLFVNSSVMISIQGTVPHEVRGRVMGLYVAVMHGGSAVGALLAGSIAELAGVPAAMVIGGVMTAVCGLVFSRGLRTTHVTNAPAQPRGPEADAWSG